MKLQKLKFQHENKCVLLKKISPQCVPFLLETQRNSATISLFFQSAIYIVLQLSAYIICNTIDLRTHFLSIMYAKRHSEMMEGSCSKNFDFCPPLKNIYYGPKTFWKFHLFIPRCHLACLLCPIQGGEYQKRFRQSVSA